MYETDVHGDAWGARLRAEHERLGADCPCGNSPAGRTEGQGAQGGPETPEPAIGPTPEVHDTSGRLCALAGRFAAGHDVDDYCRPCYREIRG